MPTGVEALRRGVARLTESRQAARMWLCGQIEGASDRGGIIQHVPERGAGPRVRRARASASVLSGPAMERGGSFHRAPALVGSSQVYTGLDLMSARGAPRWNLLFKT